MKSQDRPYDELPLRVSERDSESYLPHQEIRTPGGELTQRGRYILSKVISRKIVNYISILKSD